MINYNKSVEFICLKCKKIYNHPMDKTCKCSEIPTPTSKYGKRIICEVKSNVGNTYICVDDIGLYGTDRIHKGLFIFSCSDEESYLDYCEPIKKKNIIHVIDFSKDNIRLSIDIDSDYIHLFEKMFEISYWYVDYNSVPRLELSMGFTDGYATYKIDLGNPWNAFNIDMSIYSTLGISILNDNNLDTIAEELIYDIKNRHNVAKNKTSSDYLLYREIKK